MCQFSTPSRSEDTARWPIRSWMSCPESEVHLSLTQDIDYERELPSILAESAQEILKSLVKIKDIR